MNLCFLSNLFCNTSEKHSHKIGVVNCVSRLSFNFLGKPNHPIFKDSNCFNIFRKIRDFYADPEYSKRYWCKGLSCFANDIYLKYTGKTKEIYVFECLEKDPFYKLFHGAMVIDLFVCENQPAIILIETDFFDTISYDAAKAIIAHEVNHLIGNDAQKKILLEFIIMISGLCCGYYSLKKTSSIFSKKLFYQKFSKYKKWLFLGTNFFLGLLLSKIFMRIIALRWHRSLELDADFLGAVVCGPTVMQEALTNLEQVYPWNVPSFLEFLQTHPSYAKRRVYILHKFSKFSLT